MLENKNARLKIMTYSLFILLLGIGGYFYYEFLQQKSAELDMATEATIAKTFAGKKLDTEVLTDKKFKDLRKVEVEDSILGKDKQQESSGLTPEEINKIPRRHSNPFKPF